MKIPLQKPLKIDEKEIKEINLDLENLTGSDMLAVDRELRLRNVVGLNPIFSQDGLIIVASKACGILPDDLQRLHAPDFMEVTANVNNFLIGWGSPETVPEPAQETAQEPPSTSSEPSEQQP